MKRSVKVTKVEDTRFSGHHPNGVDVGRVEIGFEIESPIVGERYFIDGPMKWFITSKVTEIISPTKFKTENSVYEIEEIELKIKDL